MRIVFLPTREAVVPDMLVGGQAVGVQTVLAKDQTAHRITPERIG